MSILALLLTASGAHAFSLSPMSVSLEPGGKNNSASFIVDNKGPDKVAIQITMAKREMGLDGNEKNPEADDDFIVYPSQLVMSGGDKRTVRVTWAGEPKPSHELAYRIIAEQLPVDTAKPEKKDRAMIRMLLRYLGAVYITPRGAAPSVALDRVELMAGAKGKPDRLGVVLKNSGTAHAIIRSATLTVTPEQGEPVTLSFDALKEAMDGQNVLAGSLRRFAVAWPEKLARSKKLKAKLDLETK